MQRQKEKKLTTTIKDVVQVQVDSRCWRETVVRGGEKHELWGEESAGQVRNNERNTDADTYTQQSFHRSPVALGHGLSLSFSIVRLLSHSVIF